MHGLDKIFGVSPIAFGVEFAEIEFISQTELDRRRGERDLACHEGLPASFTFMIEQYAVAREQPVAFTIIHRDPVSVKFGDAVWAARVERSRFALRDLLDLAEKFGAIPAKGVLSVALNEKVVVVFDLQAPHDASVWNAPDVRWIKRDRSLMVIVGNLHNICV